MKIWKQFWFISFSVYALHFYKKQKTNVNETKYQPVLQKLRSLSIGKPHKKLKFPINGFSLNRFYLFLPYTYLCIKEHFINKIYAVAITLRLNCGLTGLHRSSRTKFPQDSLTASLWLKCGRNTTKTFFFNFNFSVS